MKIIWSPDQTRDWDWDWIRI